MRIIYARWIPKRLTDDRKRIRMDSSCEWRLKRFEQEGVDLISSIVTVDETWISLYTRETKAQTSMWKALGSLSP
jgi:hypothetical protein